MPEGKKISLSLDARRDLRQIYNYLEEQRTGLGRRFVRLLVQQLDAVVERPKSFPVIYREARRAIVDPFHVGIFFRDKTTHWEVFALIDLRRHPREWRRRT